VRALPILGKHLGAFDPAPVVPVVFTLAEEMRRILSAVDQ